MDRRRLALLVLATCMAVLAGLVTAPGSGAGTIDGLLEAAPSRLQAEGRGTDQASHPEYLLRIAPLAAAALAGTDTESIRFDPYRAGWAGTRGQSIPVEWQNRYGATIVGRLYGPARWGPQRHPAVVLVPGGGSREDDYQGIAQSLAEAGYVVLGFDPQGQGRSDVMPSPEFCDGGGAWREPQEAGVQEHGDCAGVPPQLALDSPLRPVLANLDESPAGPPASAVEFQVSYLTDREGTLDQIDAFTQLIGANYVLGALDAADFLASRDNPWRRHIDLRRVATVGHSLGAWGAVAAANGDPERRFRAAVGFDGFATVPDGAAPSVPTLFLAAENIDTDYPTVPAPDPDTGLPWLREAARWRTAGVDSAQIVLGGSTHMEWYYFAFRLLNPVYGPFINASSDGERVSVHYVLAWLDLHLERKPTGALDRLTAERFDDTADRSSIGQGTADPVTLANRPYTISGEAVADHLSPLFRSRIDAAGVSCEDLRQGCRSTT
jgi:dienelactone hydrolase